MAHPFPLFEPIWSPSREVLVTPEITSALAAGAAVCDRSVWPTREGL
jgi:hypothetical protein